MKCLSTLLIKMRKKKGGVMVETIGGMFSPGIMERWRDDKDWYERTMCGVVRTEICDGDLEFTGQLFDEPYMGGTSAAFEGKWRCNKCHNEDFPELPTKIDDVIRAINVLASDELSESWKDLRRRLLNRDLSGGQRNQQGQALDVIEAQTNRLHTFHAVSSKGYERFQTIEGKPVSFICADTPKKVAVLRDQLQGLVIGTAQDNL